MKDLNKINLLFFFVREKLQLNYRFAEVLIVCNGYLNQKLLMNKFNKQFSLIIFLYPNKKALEAFLITSFKN